MISLGLLQADANARLKAHWASKIGYSAQCLEPVSQPLITTCMHTSRASAFQIIRGSGLSHPTSIAALPSSQHSMLSLPSSRKPYEKADAEAFLHPASAATDDADHCCRAGPLSLGDLLLAGSTAARDSAAQQQSFGKELSALCNQSDFLTNWLLWPCTHGAGHYSSFPRRT